MGKMAIKLIALLLGGLLVVVSGCDKEKPAPSKQVVSQRISPGTPPKPKPAAKPAPVRQPAVKAKKGKDGSSLLEATRRLAATYDPNGRFDPFEPLFKEEKVEAQPVVSRSRKKKRRIPQTPLEKISLAQLKVSAIVRSPKGNRALVEDATGKGYVIRKGTYIGLNSGKVVAILKDKVIIEEETENLLGEYTIQKRELKLQKPAGEF